MMSKEINTKIEIRKEILELIRNKYDNICVGDYDKIELEIVQKELIEIAEMIKDKDKLLQLKLLNREKHSKNIDKYFKVK